MLMARYHMSHRRAVKTAIGALRGERGSRQLEAAITIDNSTPHELPASTQSHDRTIGCGMPIRERNRNKTVSA